MLKKIIISPLKSFIYLAIPVSLVAHNLPIDRIFSPKTLWLMLVNIDALLIVPGLIGLTVSLAIFFRIRWAKLLAIALILWSMYETISFMTRPIKEGLIADTRQIIEDYLLFRLLFLDALIVCSLVVVSYFEKNKKSLRDRAGELRKKTNEGRVAKNTLPGKPTRVKS